MLATISVALVGCQWLQWLGSSRECTTIDGELVAAKVNPLCLALLAILKAILKLGNTARLEPCDACPGIDILHLNDSLGLLDIEHPSLCPAVSGNLDTLSLGEIFHLLHCWRVCSDILWSEFERCYGDVALVLSIHNIHHDASVHIVNDGSSHLSLYGAVAFDALLGTDSPYVVLEDTERYRELVR